MWKSLIICFAICGFMQFDNVKARPQDMQAGAAMVFAAVKGAVDNGAAAKDKKEFEFMGAKFKNDMAIGFGDAMQEGARRKRSANFESFTHDMETMIKANADILKVKRSIVNEPSSELNNSNRRKRSGSFESLGQIILSDPVPVTDSSSTESEL